jgi:DNA-binding HxlR family transcriptional regulator
MTNCDCAGLNCPVDATLRLIGGKYKSLILWHLIGGELRHG